MHASGAALIGLPSALATRIDFKLSKWSKRQPTSGGRPRASPHQICNIENIFYTISGVSGNPSILSSSHLWHCHGEPRVLTYPSAPVLWLSQDLVYVILVAVPSLVLEGCLDFSQCCVLHNQLVSGNTAERSVRGTLRASSWVASKVIMIVIVGRQNVQRRYEHTAWRIIEPVFVRRRICQLSRPEEAR